MVKEAPVNVRRAGERHKIVRETDSGLGVDARAGPGGPSSPEALLIRTLLHDLVMGRMARDSLESCMTLSWVGSPVLAPGMYHIFFIHSCVDGLPHVLSQNLYLAA